MFERRLATCVQVAMCKWVAIHCSVTVMEMIPHQAPGVHLPIGLDAGFAQGFEEPFPIRVVLEDRFAPVAPIHRVIDRAGIFDTPLPSHGRWIKPNPKECQ